MKARVSKALKEVWAMKTAVHEETRHLSGKRYFDHIHQQVAKHWPGHASLRYVTYPDASNVRPAMKVAEAKAEYGKR